ncbi:hypothetical protein BC628DRAFT_1334213 [Trametes gibbosa]|nr:hypothetical protein BC628DRAFT_1334213 [Trametes gibbosa]
MQLNLASLFTLVAAFALAVPFTFAADCYSKGDCHDQCEDRNSWFVAREALCDGDGWTHPGAQSWGWGHITLNGQFDTQQECWDGFEQIIDQCLGHRNGGSYNFNSASLDVSFCKCEGLGESVLKGLSNNPLFKGLGRAVAADAS